jgi:hypothetical protein
MNKRKDARAKTRLMCTFKGEKDKLYEGKIRDISKSGLKLVSKIGSFPLGAKSLELAFHVPVSNVDITVQAQIKWQKVTEKQIETGLEFVSIRPIEKLDIGQYISSMLSLSGGTLEQRFGL